MLPVALTLLLFTAAQEADAGVSAPPPDGGASVATVEVSSQRALFEATGDFHVRLRLGFLTEWGNHPGAPLGLTLGVRLGTAHVGGVIEAWGLLPSAIGDTAEKGSLDVYSFGGTLGLCLERPVLSGELLGCALARGGVMRFEPRFIDDLSAQWQPLAAAGLRLGAEWPRESFLAFYVSAHAFVPVLRGALRGATVSWMQSWVYGGAQLGFRVRWR